MKRMGVLLLLAAPALGQVPYERIVKADKEPGNWLTYSRNYEGHRYSPLGEITTANVTGLKVKWAFQFGDPSIEVSPIAVDGILYVTGPNTAAAAKEDDQMPKAWARSFGVLKVTAKMAMAVG